MYMPQKGTWGVALFFLSDFLKHPNIKPCVTEWLFPLKSFKGTIYFREVTFHKLICSFWIFVIFGCKLEFARNFAKKSACIFTKMSPYEELVTLKMASSITIIVQQPVWPLQDI